MDATLAWGVIALLTSVILGLLAYWGISVDQTIRYIRHRLHELHDMAHAQGVKIAVIETKVIDMEQGQYDFLDVVKREQGKNRGRS